MRNQARLAVACLALLLAGCGGGTATPPSSSAPPPAATPTLVPTPAPTATPTPAPTPTVAKAQIEVGGITRDYIVATPPDVANRDPLPLLLVLHGAEMTAFGVEALTSYNAIALDPGAVVVYAQGEKDPADPSRPCCIWNSGQKDTGFDDVAFMGALMDRMEADYPIDPDRVFIVGGSNGGQMAYRAACNLAGRIAAVADIVGAMLVDCHPTQPVSVIDIHGTADTMIPIEGTINGIGQGCQPMDCPPLADTIARWRQIDGCTGDPTVTTEGRVETTTYASCADGTSVTSVIVDGGTHDWYHSNPDDRAVTWAFFMNHPRASGSGS